MEKIKSLALTHRDREVKAVESMSRSCKQTLRRESVDRLPYRDMS